MTQDALETRVKRERNASLFFSVARSASSSTTAPPRSTRRSANNSSSASSATSRTSPTFEQQRRKVSLSLLLPRNGLSTQIFFSSFFSSFFFLLVRLRSNLPSPLRAFNHVPQMKSIQIKIGRDAARCHGATRGRRPAARARVFSLFKMKSKIFVFKISTPGNVCGLSLSLSPRGRARASAGRGASERDGVS